MALREQERKGAAKQGTALNYVENHGDVLSSNEVWPLAIRSRKRWVPKRGFLLSGKYGLFPDRAGAVAGLDSLGSPDYLRMNPLRERLQSSPLLARAVPFIIFLAFTACQDSFGQAGRYWVYLAKTIVGIWLVVGLLRPLVAECRWVISWEAVVVGVGVFLLWVGVDPYYPNASELTRRVLYPIYRAIGLTSWCQPAVAVIPWNPHAQFGAGSFLAWLFVVGRLLGSSLVVPPLEEVFYRSFVYRYISRVDFPAEPLGKFRTGAFFITAVIFGFSHQEWLAGILCAFAYQGLVCWKKRLGDAMTAHAITNFLLGLWIITRGDWHFW